MGARGRARDCLAAWGGGGELPQYLQPGSRGDLRRRHPGRGQAVPTAAQRGQAARLQARVGSVPHRAGHATGHRRCVRGGRGVHSKTLGAALKRLGVIGSMVWDTIHGRDPAQAAVQEWGGISYALAALDATLPDDWEIVPLIKVGRDLAPQANAFLRSARRTIPGSSPAQQSGDVTLRIGGAALRADDRRRAALDVGRAGPAGPGSRCAVHQLHLRVRDESRDRAAAAPRLSALHVRGPAQPLPRQGAGRDARPTCAAAGTGLVRLLQRHPAERRRNAAAGQRSARHRGRRAASGMQHALRDAGQARRGVFHRDPRADGADSRSRDPPVAVASGIRPDWLRRRIRRHRCRHAAQRGEPGGSAAGGDDARRPQPDPPRRDGTARPPAGKAVDRMTRLVEVPTSFDDRSFDQFAAAYAQATDGERLLFDAHAAEWASPYGLVGLLAAGEAAARKGERPLLTAPANPDVVSYWARAGFFREAADLFEVHGKVPKVKVAVESEVLLPVTPVRAAEDVQVVVSTIQQRASAILSSELGLDPKATMGFAMALSESCQNIVEHAGTGGWVAVQAYNWRRKLARRVVVIAVADAGVGFRHSLESTQAKRFGDRWGDAAALEAALVQGVSRFRDPGRGQGLAGIRRYLARWEGKIAIRSGTARIAIVPSQRAR